jgi:hypothetical protein
MWTRSLGERRSLPPLAHLRMRSWSARHGAIHDGAIVNAESLARVNGEVVSARVRIGYTGVALEDLHFVAQPSLLIHSPGENHCLERVELIIG